MQTLANICMYTASGFVLNALTPQPQMPNFNGLGSSTGNATSHQGTTVFTGGYNISGISSAADHQIIYGQTRVGGVVVFKDVVIITSFFMLYMLWQDMNVKKCLKFT